MKVGLFISQGKLDEALGVVRSTTEIINKNRLIIGDETFSDYAIRLRKLAEGVIQTRKSSK